MFERIVCATDFSPSATNALHYALSITRTFESRLELVHAWTPFDELDEYALLRPGALDEWRAKRQAKLARLVDDVSKDGTRVTGQVLEGESDRVIVAHAAAQRADVLVVGTEGRRGIAHALLGSVAERILRTAEVPVLAVPRAFAVGEHARFAPKSLLVPVDLDPLSVDMVALAAAIARRSSARVTALHAWDEILLESEGPTAIDRAEQVRARFGRWVALHAPAAGPAIEPVVRRGAPFDAMKVECDERSVDLVVMATAGRVGLEHFMLGSVTERAVRSLGRPVLTQRRPRETK